MRHLTCDAIHGTLHFGALRFPARVKDCRSPVLRFCYSFTGLPTASRPSVPRAIHLAQEVLRGVLFECFRPLGVPKSTPKALLQAPPGHPVSGPGGHKHSSEHSLGHCRPGSRRHSCQWPAGSQARDLKVSVRATEPKSPSN